MKVLPVLAITLVAISVASATETQTRVGDRDVTVITDQSPGSPKACHAALLESVKKQGWHDEIYNTTDKDKAYLVFSQRIVERGYWTKTRITFWKAVGTADGRSDTLSQVFIVNRTDLSSFLDNEIRPLFLQFSHARLTTPPPAGS